MSFRIEALPLSGAFASTTVEIVSPAPLLLGSTSMKFELRYHPIATARVVLTDASHASQRVRMALHEERRLLAWTAASMLRA